MNGGATFTKITLQQSPLLTTSADIIIDEPEKNEFDHSSSVSSTLAI